MYKSRKVSKRFPLNLIYFLLDGSDAIQRNLSKQFAPPLGLRVILSQYIYNLYMRIVYPLLGLVFSVKNQKWVLCFIPILHIKF